MPAKKKTSREEPERSVVLDGDDYLVLELLKWPGETDKEGIQRILREAIEMPRLKEFVEKLSQQAAKVLTESREVVSIVGIEDSIKNYKMDSPGRTHIWHPKDEFAPLVRERVLKPSDEEIVKPRETPQLQPTSPKTQEKRISEPPPDRIVEDGTTPLTDKLPYMKEVKPKARSPTIPSGNPRLIRELLSKPVPLKTGKTERASVRRYPKGSKEYDEEILRLKQALEGPWQEY